MLKEIRKRVKRNNVIVHAAAVSDFKLRRKRKGKIGSGKPLILELQPNLKIIEQIKKLNREIFLVGFKAEWKLTETQLLGKAKDTLRRSKADMVVANDIKKYPFGSDISGMLIIDKSGCRKILRTSKRIIAEKIVDEINERS